MTPDDRGPAPSPERSGAAELVPGRVIAGRYRLEQQIGQGGMGSVWRARQAQLGTLFAIKFLDPLADTGDGRARFEREARAVAQIRSPHVVQVFEHGVDGAHPFMVMELLEGEDLGQRLHRERRLSVRDTARILTQAAKGLRRAHEAGVIHRDLKPSNVFLARFDDDEVVKILDFGVAKLRWVDLDPNAPETQMGMVFGSPAYMSPEQARGVRGLDHRSDLWSLAVILFRALTGMKPFNAESMGDLVIKLCVDAPPVPSAFAPDLSGEIDRFFQRAFAREPDQRFQTATEMAAEFEAIAQRQAMSAPSAWGAPGFAAAHPHPGAAAGSIAKAPTFVGAAPAVAPVAFAGGKTPIGGVAVPNAPTFAGAAPIHAGAPAHAGFGPAPGTPGRGAQVAATPTFSGGAAPAFAPGPQPSPGSGAHVAGGVTGPHAVHASGHHPVGNVPAPGPVSAPMPAPRDPTGAFRASITPGTGATAVAAPPASAAPTPPTPSPGGIVLPFAHPAPAATVPFAAAPAPPPALPAAPVATSAGPKRVVAAAIAATVLLGLGLVVALTRGGASTAETASPAATPAPSAQPTETVPAAVATAEAPAPTATAETPEPAASSAPSASASAAAPTKPLKGAPAKRGKVPNFGY